MPVDRVKLVLYTVSVLCQDGHLCRKGRGFDFSKETFKSYCDRMDMFFEANDLVLFGGAANAVADVNDIVNDMLAHRSAKEVWLNEISSVLKKHNIAAQLEIAKSFHFGKRVQKKPSIHCNFGV